jgi:ATP-dependent RNA helicase RhlE
MSSFEKFGLRKQLHNAIEDLGFKTPTPIQEQSFSVILSGKDMLGIAQTWNGKDFRLYDALYWMNSNIPNNPIREY